MFSYLNAERMGRNYDIRKYTYEASSKFSFADLKSFHEKEMSKKAYNYCIVANEGKLQEADMKKLGSFRKLSLQELFGF